MELEPEDYVIKRALEWDEAETAKQKIKKALRPSPEKKVAMDTAQRAFDIAEIKLRASVKRLREANEKKRKGES